MSLANWIALASAGISALAAIAAIVSGCQARRDARKANQSAVDAQSEANSIAVDATALQAFDWTSQYFSDVRIWADEASNCISDAIHLSSIRDDVSREGKWVMIRSRLSALIDRGRWYFPNEYENDYGNEKPPAYRGIRQSVLDYLLDAYNAHTRPPKFFDSSKKNNDSRTQEAYGKLVNSQRWFVSEIQRTLDPKNREKRVKDILKHFETVHAMRKSEDDYPPRAD